MSCPDRERNANMHILMHITRFLSGEGLVRIQVSTYFFTVSVKHIVFYVLTLLSVTLQEKMPLCVNQTGFLHILKCCSQLLYGMCHGL